MLNGSSSLVAVVRGLRGLVHELGEAGAAAVRRRGRGRIRGRQRLGRSERLEERLLLTLNVGLSSGNLLVDEPYSGADDLTVDYDTSKNEFVFRDSALNLTTSISGATGNGTKEIRVPKNRVSGDLITVQTGSLGDVITVASGFAPGSTRSLTISGGDGSDRVIWRSSSQLKAISVTAESTDVDSAQVRSSGDQEWATAATLVSSLEVIGFNVAFSGVSAGSKNLKVQGAGVVSLSGSVVATGNGTVELSGDGGVVLNSGSQVSTDLGALALNALLSKGSAGDVSGVQIINSTVKTQGGAIAITGETTASANGRAAVDLQGAQVLTQGAGTITLSGTAAATSSATGVRIRSGSVASSIVSYNGSLTLTGTSGSVDGNPGIQIDSALVQTQGTGSVTIAGTSRSAAAGTLIGGLSTIEANGGGAITIDGAAQATGQQTITFAGLTKVTPSPYVEGGLKFESAASFDGNFPQSMVGSVVNTGFVDVTSVDGLAFSVASLDVSEINGGIGPKAITFTGYLRTGGTVQQTYTTNSTFGRDTVTLNGFSNLSKFRFTFDQTTWDDIKFSFESDGEISFGAATLRATSGLIVLDTSRVRLTQTLTVDVGSQQIWPHEFTGGGAILKKGAGTLRLTGSSSNTGVMRVQQGVLQVDGSLVSAATAEGPGTLAGSGTIQGTVEIQAGGFLSPGGVPGVLQSGDLKLLPGSTLSVNLGGALPGNAAGRHDQVSVTGTVALSGNLAVDTFGGYAGTAGETLVLISNDGTDAVSGSFNSLVEQQEFLAGTTIWRISYAGGSGNDVVLVCVGHQYLVSNLNSSGAGSLYQAIVDANANAGADEIIFTIAGVIPVTSAAPLPAIAGPVRIDGSTAPGFNGVPVVEVSGVNAGSVSGFVFAAGSSSSGMRGLSIVGFAGVGVELNSAGLTLQGNWIGVKRDGTAGGNGTGGGGGAAGVIVRGTGAVIGGLQTGEGNLISGNTGHGILIVGGSGGVIQGNRIGTTPAGTAGLANAGYGVRIVDGSDNQIGGSVSTAMNVIAGNSNAGILLEGAGTTGTLIYGNRLGVDAAGNRLANGASSVAVVGSAAGTQIGGRLAGEGNVIGGSFDQGVYLANTVQTKIRGNRIGTNPAGTAKSANHHGVFVTGSNAGLQIGGSEVGEGNQISGNNGDGIRLSSTTGAIVIAGNLIGTDAAGAAALSNGGSGIYVSQSPGVLIGGATAAARNVLSGNSGLGVWVTGASSTGVSLQGNYVGVRADGQGGVGNGSGGVMVDGGAADVVVGVAGSGNVISGNNLYGIRISGAQRTQVAGNLVGSRPDGKTSLGNSGPGVHLTGDVSGTVVGGSVSGSGNVVSGNTYGIHLDQTTGSVRISANRVGTTADGLAGLGNANFGIFAYRSQSIVIGTNGDGTGDDLEGNQISGNGNFVGYGDGIVIDGNDNTAYAAVDSIVIAGNRIGTAADGMSGLWNRSTGVALRRGVSGVRIGTDGNGVSDVAERNVIAGNESYGVVVDGAGTFGNVIAGNYIGVTADSESRLLNWSAGLWIGNGAHHNRVGTDNSADSFNASERNLFGGQDALLRISGGNDNVIAGNYFGVNGAGTKQFFSVQGVVISDGSKRNLLGTDGVGGNNDRERNLIGGEAFGRVVVTGVGTDDNVIAGNWIGMGPDGVTSVGYSPQGILINGGAKRTRFGTDGNGLNDIDERNVVTGNGLGIGISGVGTSGTVVAGNYIGTDASGSQRMQNTYAMEITGGASDTRIGTDGSNDAFNVNERNIISGGGFGLRMDGVTNVTIAGNYIGLNAAGTGGIRHYEYAIRAMNHVSGLRVGTNGDGIADAAEGNVIAGGNAVGLQIFNWINMDLGIADSFIAGTIPVTTATGSFTQADLIDGTSPLAGDWTYNNQVPGRGGDYFAFRATGSLAVSTAGDYTLAMRMDRGGRLKIDGVTVATDWGGNGLTLATVNLTAGSHTLEWVGFEDTGAGGFELSVAVGGGKSGPITTANGWKVLGDAAPHAEIRLDGNLSVKSYYAAAIDSKTVIAGNLIGLLPDGVTRSPNDAYGLYVNADGVRIGGSLPVERNVISGNNGHGLIFDGWGLNGVGSSVAGNYIGVGTDGTTVVANGGLGVYAAASGLLIGGVNTGGASGVAGAGNLISGNGGAGVEVAAGVTGVSLRGNFIGTDRTGTVAVKNGAEGVVIHGQQAVVGGGVAGYGNLISGNSLEGVRVTGIGNLLQGNYIGTTLTGNSKLPNGGTSGVYIQNGFSNLVGVLDDGVNDASEGNLISGSAKYGVRLEGGGQTRLAGNRIGTNAAGTSALSNDLGGVLLASGSENWIGTDADGVSDALERNLISGNAGPGVSTNGGVVERTIIAGNFIGTDVNGTVALANAGAGIEFADNSKLSRIGGGLSADRNVVSGNTGIGISITGANSGQNWIAGNLVGTDLTGSSRLANGAQGIAIFGAFQNTIGTNGEGINDSSEGNLISGNSYQGLLLSGGGSHVVAGNRVGTNLSGTAAISNGGVGVWIDAVGNQIGSDGNGVSDSLERNLISGNAYDGVVLGGQFSSENVLRGNYIGTTVTGNAALLNGGNGVVLGGNGNSIVGGGGALRGVISGNAAAGVLIPGGFGNSVSGSFIGLAADGVTGLPNGSSGVVIQGGAQGAGVGVNGGNVISGNPGDGVTVTGSVQAQIRGNLIGTAASGLSAVANAGYGVLVTGDSAGVEIGSPMGLVSDRNLISGNKLSGVAFINAGTGNRVQGNYIGTDISGSLALGNAAFAGAFGGGVYISDGGGSQVLVGVDQGEGRHAGSANLISGNAVAGVLIRGTSSSSGGHVVSGNLIGLKAGGGGVLGNVGPGVKILNSNSNIIGSNGDGAFDSLEANVISGNSNPAAATAADYAAGVFVQDGTAGDGIATKGNVIAGNAIGSDSTGQKPLPNQGHGVLILSGFETRVGLSGAGNLLRYNGGAGVRIEGVAENGAQSAEKTLLRSNSFQGNSGLPVDVGATGITLNSSADSTADFPVFESAAIENGKMTLTGFATAGSTFELYLNAGRVGQQFGDGVTPLLTFTEGSAADTDATTGSYGPIVRGVTVTSSGAAITQNRFRFQFDLPKGLTNGVQMTGISVGPVSEFANLILAGEQGSAVPPEIKLDVVSPVSQNEGQTLTVDGSFYDPDSRGWTATVDYGDGSGVQPLVLKDSREFQLSHLYTLPGTWTVTVQIVDNGLAAGTKTFTVNVANLAPTVDFSSFVLTKNITEGGTASLSGSFTDGGGAHVVEITWGDGGTSTVNLASGIYTFSATHVYADDANATGAVTAADVYAIGVTVRDAGSAGGTSSPSGLLLVEVANAQPVVGDVKFNDVVVAVGGTVSVNEGAPLLLSGVFTDAGVTDRHTVRLDWGDGTKSDVILAVGDRTFGSQSQFTHVYTNNSADGPRVLTLEFWDDDQPAEPTKVTWNIAVADVAASAVLVNAVPTSPDEMQVVQISGSFVDPGAADAHQVRVIWGDGTPDSILNLDPGVRSFGGTFLTHAYADNRADGTAYGVQVVVSDLALPTAQGSGSRSVTVQNVGPTMVGGLSVKRVDGTTGAVNEGDFVVVTGAFADASPVDRHRVLISWGDGKSPTEASVNAEDRTFSARYRYGDNFAAASITATVTDGRIVAGVFVPDGGSVTSAAVTQQVNNVAPAAQIAPRLGSTPANTLLTVDVVEPGLDDVPGLTYLWEVNTGISGYSTLATSKNVSFNAMLLGTPLIRVTVSDDDGGVDQYEVVAVFGTDAAETISVTTTGFTRSGSGFGGAGLSPGEGLWSNQILVLGYGGEDFLDASALTSSFTVILDGGQQQDYLLGGAGADLFYPNDGNDTVDGGLGSDSYFLKPNSVLTVIDTSGDNVLDFSLANFADSTGITFDLTRIRSTGAPSASLDAQVVSTAGGTSHIVAAYGTFSSVTGSAYGDSLTAASGSTVDGGAGKDTFYVGAGTSNATVSGGADDDVLYTTGTGITGLTFSGDDGFDYLKNTGSITGLTFGGGADDDILENVGSILGQLNFSGDDGVDVLTNTGTIGTLVFGGGADDDIFVNNGSVPTTLSFGGDDDILLSGAGTVGTLVFSGDSGADIFANLGTITSLTFSGGADDDVFVNVGTSTSLNFGGAADVTLSNSGTVGSIGSLIFSGDDGADILRNFGSLGTLNFAGGADDDLLLNYSGATVTALVFGGDDGADTLWNQGILTTLNFGGGADDDVLLNSAGASVGTLVFGGDDGSDLLQNLGTISTLTFGGGADDDVLYNSGTVLTSLTFGGDAGADILQNVGAIAGLTFGGGADDDVLLNYAAGTITTLGFGGDDGIDTLQNAGGITTLNFGGGADGDAFVNLAGATIGTMFFGGNYVSNGSGGWQPMSVGADDGADSLVNSGTIASLLFRGGADDDVLSNRLGGIITTLNFGGDDGADLLQNLGTAGTLTFGGGADDDVLVNRGTVIGALIFGGDQQFDGSGNLQPIGTLSDDGADTLANYGTVGSIVFGGGADDDVLLNASGATVSTSLAFSGDSGNDIFRNEGTAAALIFSGGADDDILVNLAAGVGSISFGGDAGADVLVNQGSGVGTLTFAGGADDDLLLNTASSVMTLTFSGGADDDVLQNSGSSITTLRFTGDSGADILLNTGSGIASLTFGGGADDDVLTSTGTNIGVLVFGGDIDASTGLPICGTNAGDDLLILRGSGTGAAESYVLFQGDDGADGFLNAASGFASLTFNGGADNDVFQNTVSSIGGIAFNGGADDDVLQNSGSALTGLVFDGDSGADVLYNTGAAVAGLVFTGGADDDIFYNTGSSLAGAVFTGGADEDVLVNTGTGVTGLIFNGGADDDVLQNSGVGLLDLLFSGDAGNDRFWNRAAAVDGRNLQFIGGDGDDLLLNDAGGLTGLVFTGGADDDGFQNSGVNISGLRFEGGADDDVFVNTSSGAILDLRFGGGADDDILQNSGTISTLLIGGGADDDVLANWGSVTTLTFMGDGEFDGSGNLTPISSGADDGADTLVNYGAVETLTFSGGADDDVLVNNGEVTTLTFSGGSDDDTLQNNDVVAVLTFNGGADDDVFIANADNVGAMVFNGDDGADSLINNGDSFASLTFNGGAGADVLRVLGSGLGNVVFNGGSDVAADTFNYSGTAASGSGVTFAGGPGNDLLAWRGTADTLNFTGGAGDDSCIIVGSGVLSLDGGDGDDTVYFQADLQASVTVVESGGGSGDTSSDTLNFSSYTGGSLNLDLRSTAAQAQSSKFNLTLSNGLGLENVVGTSGADTIYGNARNNRIYGAEYTAGYGTATGGSRGQTQWVLLDFDSKTDESAGEHVYTAAEREAIRSRVEGNYRGADASNPWFDVRVVLTASGIPSGVSEYAVITFNDTPAFGRPGGLASEIDPGNLSFGGTAVVQVNGLLGGVITADDVGGEGGDAGADKGYRPEFGDEQIGASKPEATSENFVLLSAKIAAHELAHLMGLRHQDSFGPIGFGVHDPPGVSGYNPQFPGPAGGVETFDHLMGTGASVGSNRFNDLRGLFFAEREAMKLVLATSDHAQTFVAESASAHGSHTAAQALGLTTVSVPNTLSSGLNDNKSFSVQMKSVIGEIAVDSSTGKSQNDWYSFSGSAGDVVNIDLYSNSLTRYGTAADNYIDSIVRVWYLQGGVLTEVPWFTSTAVNDDTFEPTDSSIVDLLLPVTGTYFIEVDTFKRDPASSVFDPTNPTSPINPSNPNNILGYADLLKRFLDTRDDTDVGRYQLVISRFSKANESDGTDTIKGFGGTDTIDGGAGDDYSLSVSVGGSGTSTEGATFTRSISVTDRAATSWSGSTVNYGDGSGSQALTVASNGTASLSHVWTDNGTYTVTVTIVDDIGQSKSESFTVTVSNVNPVLLTLTGESNPVEATSHTYSFTASDVGADTFSVSSVSGGTWGTVSDFTINSATGAGTFKVTFGKGASTVIRLRLQDDDSGLSNELTLTATIQLLNNAPTNISLSPASVSENLAIGTVVGDFSTTDPDGDAVFTYSLVSGAGATDNALFSISGGQLRTAAVFDYEQASSRSVRVRTTDAGGLSFEKAIVVSITDIVDETPPVSTLAALPSTWNSRTVTISASGTDPGVGATGIKEFELYYSIGGGYVKFATVPLASPSAVLNLPVANKTYWFRSNAVDNQGNREAKTVGDTSTYVGDVFPPSSQASTLSWNSSGQFEMQITGSKSSGQPILYFDVYMIVDGGSAQKVDSVGAVQTSAGQFGATSRVTGVVDGQQHTYGFYSVAVDGSGNVEAAPGTPDRTATVTFTPTGLTSLGISTQNGIAQRSYVRYLDVLFSSSPTALLSGGRVRVEKFAVNAASVTPLTGTSVTGFGLSAVDKRLKLDFGTSGLGGVGAAGDGFYRVLLDLNGNGVFAESQDAAWEFFRLFGDTDGNGAVTTADIAVVASQLGQTGTMLNGDTDGSGGVNATDRQNVQRRFGAKLLDWMLPLIDG